MQTLLLEIGTEEIPAGYIDPALAALRDNLDKQLTRARIDHEAFRTYATPRRLTVMVDGVADRQAKITEEILGPPERVAFDDQKQPTMAARKFAEKVQVPLKRLTVKETPKGRYLCTRKTDRGAATITLLKTILPEVVLATPFPKVMKWGEQHIQFARPIHSIVALLGSRLVSLAVGNVRSGRHTKGHFFMKGAKIKLNHPDEYLSTLSSVDVLADIGERRAAVKADVDRAAANMGGAVLADDELLDIVTNLVEMPYAVTGRFDDEFLELPDEVLITAMREHQKYFAVGDAEGRLMPGFIAVNNTQAKDMDLVAQGHERVIRARLADAQFFYRADLKVPLDDFVSRLRGVTFQAKLGTVHSKVQRVARLAEALAPQVQAQSEWAEEAGPDFSSRVARAALLSKSDLVSEMVGEFPKLQGVMGRIYATQAGEAADVAAAVEDHYRPVQSGGALPDTLTGAVVSIADKMDSICGFFSVNLIPTGGADPYALRRQGIGAVRVLRARNFDLSLSGIIDQALSAFDLPDDDARGAVAAKILEFLTRRIARILADEGYSKDIIAAVTVASVDRIPDVWQRVAALEALKKAPDFEPLAISFKRVVNIIKKSGDQGAHSVDLGCFQEAAEEQLLAACENAARKVESHLAQNAYGEALKVMAGLRPAVDRFFDDVMVMAQDARIRANRLALLTQVAGLFNRFADFSQIST
jgi:glycyl-tRNA synthetase beta chain